MSSRFFYIDVFSLLPSAFDVVHVATNSSACTSNSSIKILRVIRILRLFKLLRLLKGSDILKRLLGYVSLSVKEVRLIQLFLTTILLVHGYACLL